MEIGGVGEMNVLHVPYCFYPDAVGGTEIYVESLAQSQIFVFPARRDEAGDQDNLPTVLIEAMAGGLPIVTSSLAGIPEIITDQINGILVPQRAPEALASAIRSLLLDPKKREKLGASGLSTAREKFSLAATVQELIALFERQID